MLDGRVAGNLLVGQVCRRLEVGQIHIAGCGSQQRNEKFILLP